MCIVCGKDKYPAIIRKVTLISVPCRTWLQGVYYEHNNEQSAGFPVYKIVDTSGNIMAFLWNKKHFNRFILSPSVDSIDWYGSVIWNGQFPASLVPGSGICQTPFPDTVVIVNNMLSALISNECLQCPASTSSPNISTSITNCQCNAGFTGADAGPCSQCGAGTYKAELGLLLVQAVSLIQSLQLAVPYNGFIAVGIFDDLLLSDPALHHCPVVVKGFG